MDLYSVLARLLKFRTRNLYWQWNSGTSSNIWHCNQWQYLHFLSQLVYLGGRYCWVRQSLRQRRGLETALSILLTCSPLGNANVCTPTQTPKPPGSGTLINWGFEYHGLFLTFSYFTMTLFSGQLRKDSSHCLMISENKCCIKCLFVQNFFKH